MSTFDPLGVLRARPEMMLRLALVPIIWGLALSLWFSMGRAVLSRSLPPVEAQLERQAALFSDKFNILAARGNSLVNDDRITAGTDDQADTLRRRALYEFSYLQNSNDVYVTDGKGRNVWFPLNAQALPVSGEALVNTVGRTGLGTLPIMVSRDMSRLLLVQRHKNGETVIGTMAPWSKFNQAQILTPNGTPVVIFYSSGGKWWQLNPATGAARSIGKPDLRIDREMLGLAPTVTAATRIPGWDGWWVAATLNVMNESKTVFGLQMATLVAALVMSLLLAWKPWDSEFLNGAGSRSIRVRARIPGIPGLGGFLGGDFFRIKSLGNTGTFYHGGGMSGVSGFASGRRSGGGMTEKFDGLTAPSVGELAKKHEKQRQRDSVHFNNMVQKIRSAMQTPNGVRGVYQPVFRASDGLAVMNEVLLRLAIPNEDDMTPADFLAVAKKADLLPALDATLLKNVVAHNFKQGVPHTRLALNVSSTTFDHMIYMREIVRETNPTVMQHLVFELRSRELIGDRGAMDFLFELKDMGAELSVDYFGGTAMLEMSHRMGFDHVKINALEMWEDLNKRRELVGLAKTATRIGMPLILEKVETLQMEVFARRIGIPYLQGYHFAKPSAEPFIGQMATWRQMAKEAATLVDLEQDGPADDE